MKLSKSTNLTDFNFMYSSDDSIKEKIETICTEIYRCSSVSFSDTALDNIKKLEELQLDKVPVALAKSQYDLGFNKDIVIKDVKLNNGAGFITVYLNNIMTMPGLSKKPAYLGMHIDGNYNISGLF